MVAIEDSRYAWSQLPSATRLEVLKLAQKGERHPDPVLAAAASGWAHHPAWTSGLNRLPGWLLPAAGSALAMVCFVMSGFVGPVALVLAVLSLVAVGAGLLGWNQTAAARAVRRLSR